MNLILVGPWGAAGLAWSTASAALVQNALMIAALRRYTDNPLDRAVWLGWAKTAGLTLLMALALAPLLWHFNARGMTRTASALYLGALVGVGGLIFLGGAWLTKAEEIGWLRRRRRTS